MIAKALVFTIRTLAKAWQIRIMQTPIIAEA